jgi:hypothetical protein
VSALVVDAVRERLRGADMAVLVAEIVGDKPLTAKERAWAAQVLAP